MEQLIHNQAYGWISYAQLLKQLSLSVLSFNSSKLSVKPMNNFAMDKPPLLLMHGSNIRRRSWEQVSEQRE